MAFGFGFGLPRGGNTIWSPASLFAQNEPGVWYDPSDMATLFQDAEGTTPVTAVEQPVGLMLDKSRGLVLGSELVTNGDFSQGSTGWTGVDGTTPITVVANEASLAAGTYAQQGGKSFLLGKSYQLVFSVKSSGVVAPRVFIATGAFLAGAQDVYTYATNTYAGVTYLTAIITPNANKTVLVFKEQVGSSGTLFIDNISVRELPGVHATSLTTSRPVLTARVNLLTKTEQFDDAVWTASKSAGASVSANTTVAPNGTTTADTVTFTASSDYLYQAIANYPAVTGASVTFSIYAKTATQIIVFGGASPAGTDVYAFVNAGNGWFKQTVTRTFTVTTSAVTLQTLPIGTFVGAGSFPIWGASLTTTDQASLGYQRVNTATDYDTVGFPMWLKADGVDDYMVTGTLAAPVNLDLTSTDKVTVATGVRKLSDAATGMLTELSANINTNNGAFYVAAPSGANNYEFSTKGTAAVVVARTGFAAPISNVLTLASSISAPTFNTRVDTVASSTSTSSQGTGNYGTYPLYQFRRAGTTLPFNGLSAGLTVVGRTLTAAELSQLETYYQQKTKAY